MMHHLSIVHCPSPAHQDIPEATDKGRQGRQGSKDGPEDVVRGPGSSGDSFGAQRFLAFRHFSAQLGYHLGYLLRPPQL